MITPPLTTRHAVALQASFTDATTPHVAQAGERSRPTLVPSYVRPIRLEFVPRCTVRCLQLTLPPERAPLSPTRQSCILRLDPRYVRQADSGPPRVTPTASAQRLGLYLFIHAGCYHRRKLVTQAHHLRAGDPAVAGSVTLRKPADCGNIGRDKCTNRRTRVRFFGRVDDQFSSDRRRWQALS